MLGSAFYTYEAVAHMCGRAVYVLYVTLKQAATLLHFFLSWDAIFLITDRFSFSPFARRWGTAFFPYISRHLQVNEYSHWTKSTYRAYNTYSDNVTLHTNTQCIPSFYSFSYFQLNAGQHRLIFMWANAFWSSLNVHTNTRIRTFPKIGKIHDNKM